MHEPEDLFILGTNVHAFEMVEMVDRINSVKPTWRLRGFVSANPAEAQKRIKDFSVLSWDDAQRRYAHARVVPDATRPLECDIPRNRLATLIDPAATVSKSAKIGVGCVVYPFCFVGHNASIGDGVFCLSRATINHDDVIDDFVAVTSGVLLAGNVRIGANCYLGQGCTIRQFVEVKKGSLVGMGSVVIQDVPPDSVVVGNPARVIRKRKQGE